MNGLYTSVKRYEKLSSQVADQIINMILSGTLNVGDRIPTERELCVTFDVSRTVIREAVSIIKAKGLIESNGRNGTVVRNLQGGDVASSIGMLITLKGHPATIENLMEVRRALEIQTARLAAERATKEDIKDLQEILQWMEKSLDEPEKFSEYDLKFHYSLARATQNPLFEILLDPLTDALLEGIRLSVSLPGVPEEGYKFHCSILEKVIAHDGSGASREMFSHLSQSQRVTSKAIKEKNQN